MSIKDTFSAISSTEKVASALLKWIAADRGIKAGLLVELKENIELIRLYIDTEADAKELAPKLNDTAYRAALKSGFNFDRLNPALIDELSTANKPQLIKYHNWSTRQLFESVYAKVTTVKHAATLKEHKKPLRLGVRIINIFNQMIVLANHIGNAK